MATQAVFLAIFLTGAAAQDLALRGTTIRDFTEPGIGSSRPANFLAMGGSWYFTAYHPLYGTELWKSDGTEAGTVLLKDTCPGPATGADSSQPFQAAGGAFYLRVLNDATGYELWKSDGTETGTALLNDVRPGFLSSNPTGFAAWNDHLYFRAATDGGIGVEFWKSDGTAYGTALLKDLAPNGKSGIPGGFTPDGDMLYFFAGEELSYSASSPFGTARWTGLWKTDGTPAGTTPVSTLQVTANLSKSDPHLTKMGTKLHFLATQSNGRGGVWVSDGTAPGTKLQREWRFPEGEKITATGTVGFFRGQSPAVSAGMELCRFDSVTGVVSVVKDIFPGGANSSLPTQLTESGERVFFSANDGTHGAELWISDGTEPGTVMVKDIHPGAGSSLLSMVCVMDGILYFTAVHPDFGRELWRSDGTAAGTVLVKDIRPGPDSGNPLAGAAQAGTILFSADDGTHGVELWKSDGTAAGTVLVKDIQAATAGGDTVTIRSSEGSWGYLTKGNALWRTDATAEGTYFLANVRPYSSLERLGERAVFGVSTAALGVELWTSDGTPEGTKLIADMRSGSASFLGLRGEFAKWEGSLLFAGNDGVRGAELWKTDGTAAGTVLVKDIAPSGDSVPRFLKQHGDAWYFSATRPDTGEELWKTDGTEAGTVLVKDLVPGTGSAAIKSAASARGKLFLHMDSALWTSDGTTEGTVRVMALSPPPTLTVFGASPDAPMLAVGDEGVIFQGYDDAHGSEPWISDGTPEGTGLLKDVFPGPGSSDFAEMISFGETVIFTANTPDTGREIWRTDGTEDGTVLLKDVWDGPLSGVYGQRTGGAGLHIADGIIYFHGKDAAHGLELWRSDGTTGGTRLVEDLAPGFASSFPGTLHPFAGKLLSTAQTDGVRRGLLRVYEPSAEEPPAEVSDGFDDAEDTGWTRHDPAGAAGASGYTFPNGGYRLAAGPSANVPELGPARAGALRPGEEYGEFCAAVDVTGWDAASDTAISVLARLQVGSGLTGYALTCGNGGRSLEIRKLTNGTTATVSAGATPVTLDPAKSYRFVFFGLEGYLEGRVYESTDWLTPIASVTAMDATHASGSNGLLVASPSNSACAAVFDNYRANTGPAPELDVLSGPDGAVALDWDAERGLCWRLESSADLAAWEPRAGSRHAGGIATLELPPAVTGARRAAYFRFAKGPASVP